MHTFEQLQMTEMEMKIHTHKNSLTPAQQEANLQASKKPDVKKPLQVTHIGPEDIAAIKAQQELPYLV